MKTTKPTGKTLNRKKIVFVLIVLLATVGAGGYFTYNQFFTSSTDQASDKSTESQKDKQSTTVAEKTVKLKEICTTHEKICFNYPEGWEVTLTINSA